MPFNPDQTEEINDLISSALEPELARLETLIQQNYFADDYTNRSRASKPTDFFRSLRLKAVTPAQLGASQNDYNAGDSPILRLASGAAYNLTGFANGADGKAFILINVGAYNLSVLNESASSVAANRVTTASGATVIIAPNGQLTLWYDVISARWRSNL